MYDTLRHYSVHSSRVRGVVYEYCSLGMNTSELVQSVWSLVDYGITVASCSLQACYQSILLHTYYSIFYSKEVRKHYIAKFDLMLFMKLPPRHAEHLLMY